MKLIGLTGGIASGKSLIENMLRTAHIPVINADDLSREVTAPGSLGLRRVIDHFGEEYLLPDGSLDRKKLGKNIFINEISRKELENIVHPLISQRFKEYINTLSTKGEPYCVYSAPLLFEKDMQGFFDSVILVVCDEKKQIQRLRKRDNISEEEARLRMSSQLPLDQKKEKTRHHLNNNDSPENSAKNLSTIWHEITGNTITFS